MPLAPAPDTAQSSALPAPEKQLVNDVVASSGTISKTRNQPRIQLVTEVVVGHPLFACRKGCNRCCHVLPPLVLGVEWPLLHAHLLKAPPAVQAEVIAMAELLRPLEAPLAVMRQLALDHRAVTNDFGFQCSFLVEGLCAAYAARPLVCRAYGYVYRTRQQGAKQEASMLMSDVGRAFLTETWVGTKSQLPVINPYEDQLKALNHQAGGGAAFLPQWLWAHLDGGRLIPETRLNPDFSVRGNGAPPPGRT